MKTNRGRKSRDKSWEQHTSSCLAWFQDGFERGLDSALWDAVIFCVQTETQQPEWLRDALMKYAKDRINGIPLKKRGRGHPESSLILRTFIFESVNHWREQKIVFGRAQQPRPFSWDRAFKRVQKELEEAHNLSLSPGAIRAAYNGIKKILADPKSPYIVSPFADWNSPTHSPSRLAAPKASLSTKPTSKKPAKY